MRATAAVMLLLLPSAESFIMPSAMPFRWASSASGPSAKLFGTRAIAITVCKMSYADAMGACSKALLAAGDHTVAAAAILGENQCDEEDPASLSAGGCAIANAGRDLEAVAAALEEREWEEVVWGT